MGTYINVLMFREIATAIHYSPVDHNSTISSWELSLVKGIGTNFFFYLGSSGQNNFGYISCISTSWEPGRGPAFLYSIWRCLALMLVTLFMLWSA